MIPVGVRLAGADHLHGRRRRTDQLAVGSHEVDQEVDVLGVLLQRGVLEQESVAHVAAGADLVGALREPFLVDQNARYRFDRRGDGDAPASEPLEVDAATDVPARDAEHRVVRNANRPADATPGRTLDAALLDGAVGVPDLSEADALRGGRDGDLHCLATVDDGEGGGRTRRRRRAGDRHGRREDGGRCEQCEKAEERHAPLIDAPADLLVPRTRDHR